MSHPRDEYSPPEESLENVTAKLRAIQREVGWKRVMSSGELVLSALFEGGKPSQPSGRATLQALERLHTPLGELGQRFDEQALPESTEIVVGICKRLTDNGVG